MGSLGIWYLVLAKPQLSFELSEVRRFSFLSFYDPQKWRYSKFLKHRDPHFQLSQGYRAKEGGQQLPLFMRGFCSSNALFSASLHLECWFLLLIPFWYWRLLFQIKSQHGFTFICCFIGVLMFINCCQKPGILEKDENGFQKNVKKWDGNIGGGEGMSGGMVVNSGFQTFYILWKYKHMLNLNLL